MRTRQLRSRQGGMSLLEAMLAILIFSIGILALVALQSTSVKATTESKLRGDAGFLASQIIAQMWTDSSNLQQYQHNPGGADCAFAGAPSGHAPMTAWVAAVQQALPGATANSIQVVVTNNPGATDHNRVALTICWTPPGADAPRRFATVTQINL